MANQSSIRSIEEPWLKVPLVREAAGFNAQPVTLPNKRIQDIYRWSDFILWFHYAIIVQSHHCLTKDLSIH
jgi:hypothetical protein